MGRGGGCIQMGLSVFGVGRLSANLILCGNNCTVLLGGGGGPFFIFHREQERFKLVLFKLKAPCSNFSYLFFFYML